MHVYIYIYINTNITYIDLHMTQHAYVYVCMCVYTYIHSRELPLHNNVTVCIHDSPERLCALLLLQEGQSYPGYHWRMPSEVDTYVCMCVCVNVCVWMCLYVYVCVGACIHEYVPSCCYKKVNHVWSTIGACQVKWTPMYACMLYLY